MGRFTHRYWDGLAWTEHVAQNGQQSVDSLHPEAPASIVEATVVEAEIETVATTESGGRHRAASISRFSQRNEAKASEGRQSLEITRMTRKSRQAKTATTARTAPSLLQMVQQLQLEEPRHPLDEQIEVAGETYAVKGIKKAFRDFSMPISERGTTLEDVQITLVPEPWNPHDPNAVAVMVGQHHVGYIPADTAVDYSYGLGQLAARGWLATGVARIWAKTDGGVVRARVTILIPEAVAFD
jgi:hypothetical protein